MESRTRHAIVVAALAASAATCGDDGAHVQSATTEAASETTGATTTTVAGDVDSGTTTDSTGATQSESTGTGSVCGNDVVEAGEQCDGGEIAGVACPADCRFDVEGGDEPYAIVGFADGRTVVAGKAALSAFMSRISVTGELDWSTRPEAEKVNDLIAPEDNVVIAGGERDRIMWISGFDLEGSPLWENTLGGPDELGPYQPGSVTQLSDGRIALVGSTDVAADEPGYLATYDLDGALDEMQTFAGPPYSEMLTLSNIPVLWGAAQGDGLVVTARAWHAPESVGWLQSRGVDGSVGWEQTVEPAVPSGLSNPMKPAVAPDGSVALTMQYQTTDQDPNDIWIGKFSAEGELLWSEVYEGPYGREDIPRGIACDAEGRIFVHGNVANDDFADPGQRDYDMVLLAYSADGDQRWIDFYSGDGMGDGAYSWDYGGPVAVDMNGFLLVAGSSMSPATDYDVLVRLVAP